MLKHCVSTKTIPKRIVVMGAGGFIGASLVKTLKSSNIPFISLTEKNMNLLDSEASDRLVNILNADDTLVVISAIAPCKNIEMLLQKISMMKTVCEAIERKQPKHLIYLSSDAVYADSPNPLTENSSAEPGSLHGVMHLSREIMLKQVCTAPMVILRPSLIYGSEDTHNGYGPNRFISLALQNKSISIFGNGEEKRDHVYIRDVVNIIVKCIINKKLGIFNIATGKVYSFKDLANRIINLSKSKSKLIKIKRKGPMPHNGYRPFNINLIKNNFKNIKMFSIENGIKKYLENI